MESNNLKTPNQIPQPEPRFDMTNNQPESKLGPVIGSVIIIIILLVGGFFLWKTLADNRANTQENDTMMEEDNEIEGITEEDLNELEENTAELEADLEVIEDDLDQIEAEVEAESEGEI